ncbi:MAG: dihydroorotase [Deltaproteobacteria bacterium]|nr:dihydroorotase [Deltaproteobacteria bacterium]
MSDLFLTNGLVIDPARDVREKINCVIRRGRVAEWTKAKQPPTGVPVLDVDGAVVAPGFIDLHVHFRDPGEEYKEDIASGLAAAAAGGFTSVVCMANTKPVNDCAAVTRYMRHAAQMVDGVRLYPVGAMTRGLAGEALADIGDLAAEGVVGISDDGKTVANTLIMRRAMEYASDFQLPVIVHCEDPHLAGEGVMHEGAVSTRLGLRGRPSASEYLIVERDITLAQLTNARLHVQHVSAREAVEAVRRAKAAKVGVTVEVTPHHLFLTDETLADFDPNYKMYPPLRTEADQTALRRALKDGTIDAIATDHAPHSTLEKEERPIELAAAGVIGLETAVPVSYRLVEERLISLSRFVDLLTRGPAAALRLPHGRLAVGDTADVTVFDPRQQLQIDATQFRSKSRNCPFHGWICHGKVLFTIVGGRICYEARMARSG